MVDFKVRNGKLATSVA